MPVVKSRFYRSNFGVKSYHRWEGEGKKAFSAFVAFRQLTPELRDVNQFALDKKLKLNEVEEWYEKFDWYARAKDWDAEEERQLRWKKFRKIEQMNQNQAALGNMCQSFALKQLRKLMATADADANAVIPASVMLQMAKIGADLERVARGEATEIKEEKGQDSIDLKKLSVDELVALQELKDKAKRE